MKKITRILIYISVFTASVVLSVSAAKPNIVIIFVDDMGMGDLSIQNPDSKIPTPYLDELARSGMLFSDAHSSAATCTPSRYSLLTGQYHWRSFDGIANSFEDSVFEDEELTLPEMLREVGYNTAAIGKWHLGFDWKDILNPGFELKSTKGFEMAPEAFDWSKKVPGGPTAHGFDYYFGDGTPNFPPYVWIENDKTLGTPTVSHTPTPTPEEGNPECRPGPGMPGWRLDLVMPKLTERAVKWIGEQKEKDEPFFLYFSTTSPHTPIVPAPEFVGTSQAGPYGDFMVQTDWSAGQVLEALEENGFAENTIVIFSSDNGSPGRLTERDLKFGHNSSGTFRGAKAHTYEGGHRVPFIVRWPGMVEAGSQSDALTSQLDIMATLAEFLEYTIPEGQARDSKSMLPVLKQEKAATRNMLVYHNRGEQFGIRQGGWLLLNEVTFRQKSGSARLKRYNEKHGFPLESEDTELYNLSEDPGQRKNLIDQYPERAEQLQALLAEIRSGASPQ